MSNIRLPTSDRGWKFVWPRDPDVHTMTSAIERGSIPVSTCPGGVDLRLTLESGQSYHWRRDGGEMYDDETAAGWYVTVIDGTVIRVRQAAGAIQWEATDDATPLLRRCLRLDDDLDAIMASVKDPLVTEAFDRHRGMRLVRDPPFTCLVSFICSTQMRVGRIHSMVTTLMDELGQPVASPWGTYHEFPTPDRLAAQDEATLRSLGLGYRAPYVWETANMVATGAQTPTAVVGADYEDARGQLTNFVGVGEKVADCVLLFSLEFLQAVPLDTWIRRAIETFYPECDRTGYAATSAAIRARFGDEYAGYAQTYVFHHLRTGGRPIDRDAVATDTE